MEQKKEFLASVYSRSGLGLNCGRICMGSSDYATEAYSYADHGPDPELKNFSVEHDRSYLVPVVRDARKVNPELFLVASPWSPPGWMKANGTMFGGSMRRKYLATYAEYFNKFLDAYAEMGVDVDAITIQNEVDTDQEGLMPAWICQTPRSGLLPITWGRRWPSGKARRRSGFWTTTTTYGAAYCRSCRCPVCGRWWMVWRGTDISEMRRQCRW